MPSLKQWIVIFAWMISIVLALLGIFSFATVEQLNGYQPIHVIIYEIVVILSLTGMFLLIYKKGAPGT